MLFHNFDFTLYKYENLCKAISNSKFQTLTFREYFERKGRGEKIDNCILIRHDVDENIRYSVDMAKVEFENGIKSTYYFRMKNNVYIPDAIQIIASDNHEIGYHYETLDKSSGDIDKAIETFSVELDKFREKFDIKTVCMHGNPLTKYDNRMIWKTCSLSQFELLGEPYLSLDYNDFLYISDSGRTWSNSKNKVKDKLISGVQEDFIKDTDDLIEFITNKTPEKKNICILTHPERWNKSNKDYLLRLFIDYSYICGKIILRLLPKSGGALLINSIQKEGYDR